MNADFLAVLDQWEKEKGIPKDRLLNAVQESLVAASAAGEVKRFTISGPAAKFGMENVASSHDYAGQKEQLFSLDVHTKSSRVAAAGFNGEVVIWDSESDRRILRFVASP